MERSPRRLCLVITFIFFSLPFPFGLRGTTISPVLFFPGFKFLDPHSYTLSMIFLLSCHLQATTRRKETTPKNEITRTPNRDEEPRLMMMMMTMTMMRTRPDYQTTQFTTTFSDDVDDDRREKEERETKEIPYSHDRRVHLSVSLVFAMEICFLILPYFLSPFFLSTLLFTCSLQCRYSCCCLVGGWVRFVYIF